MKSDKRIQGDFLVYGSSGIVGTHIEYLVEGPGVIVGRKGNVGSVFWANSNFYPIDTVYYVVTDLSLYYVYYNLQTQNFINNDAAVPGLNRNQAYSLPIITPNSLVLDQFDENVSLIFEQIVFLNISNQKLREARDILLPRLVSGELAVSGLDIDQLMDEMQGLTE